MRLTERRVAVLPALLISQVILGAVAGIPRSTGAPLLGRDGGKLLQLTVGVLASPVLSLDLAGRLVSAASGRVPAALVGYVPVVRLKSAADSLVVQFGFSELCD